MQRKIGGDRLGSGNRMKVDLHGYGRSTHNQSKLWRSTLAAGTLVPFLNEIGLPGTTFDIELNCEIQTHPTVGPLFGSYKVQLDIFEIPVRLYNGRLHNNAIGIGMKMADIKLPQMTLQTKIEIYRDATDKDNCQINPSCLLAYLGIRGIGVPSIGTNTILERDFSALGLLGYWDTVKNYYSNKQEEDAWVIHQQNGANIETVDEIQVNSQVVNEAPAQAAIPVSQGMPVRIFYTGATPNLNQIVLTLLDGTQVILGQLLYNVDSTTTPGEISASWQGSNRTIMSWEYQGAATQPIRAPKLVNFPLADIDRMRELILQDTGAAGAFNVTDESIANNVAPYTLLLGWDGSNNAPYANTQEGLAVKTYQSDLFNNWINTETIDGTNGVNELTAIDVSGGLLYMDTLVLQEKVYEMLNRIAVSGGTYNDWIEVQYDHERYMVAESPIYHGGLIKELVFQEVISNSAAGEGDGQAGQPLGTLGGRGIMAKKHKGGRVTIKCQEPSYIMGIVSLTPRIDYSQGNKWYVHLKTMDDFHKPALDQIGFQDLITEQMAWWDTASTAANVSTWVQRSAGKQPAWVNYMTNVNETLGNFAIADNEMFMTLNRRYEPANAVYWSGIGDLTTYIDPSKFNNSFAQTSLDAMNFWVQISVDNMARRKMSAKVMPNL